jgi:26S proteasome regulatory subunit T4
MSNEEYSSIDFSEIGGLNEQTRKLREVIELPLANPELFIRVGIKAPRESSSTVLRGGKTLLARALSSNINGTFMKVVASAIVDNIKEKQRESSERCSAMRRTTNPV